MSNFPAGSKIIITNAEEGETYKNGDIFAVNATNGVGVWISCADSSCYISSYEFEAYTEPFKVGDKVITTAADAVWEYGVGVEGTVTHIDTGEPKICVSGLGYAYTWDLKLAPAKAEPERKFKVGDKVVVQANPSWAEEGQTGVIERVDLEDSGLPYDVKGDEEWNFWMREQDLELVKEFTFADIQKGDTIRAEYVANGVKITREGVADKQPYYEWDNGEGMLVADTAWGATYTLLERTEPPKPNPFAEAKVGSIATYGEEGIKYLKTGDNAWAPISRKGTLSDYRNSDESMTNCGDLIQVTHNA